MKKTYISPEAEIVDLVALEQISLLGGARGNEPGTGIIGGKTSVGDADDDEY